MNNKRWIHYLELAIAVAGMTILYLILRDFQWGEPLFQDEGKTRDVFVERFVLGTNDGLGQNFFAYCQYNIQNMVIFALGKLFGSAAVGINLYHIATFWGIAFSAYWLFEKIGVSHSISLFASILLTILPYHTDRGEAQIITSSFFMVPVITAIIYDIYYVGISAQNYRKNVIILLILPWVDLNLALMTLILLLFLCLHRREKDAALWTAVCGIPTFVESMILYTLSNANTGNTLTDNVDRAREEGLRILDFIMPVRRHIYGRFFNIRFEYDGAFSANGESGLNTMGFLLALCFVVGMMALFVGRKGNQLIRWLSWINLLVILTANISGLGLLAEYFGIHITFWNRMGIFVIVNTAVVMAISADWIKSQIQQKRYQILCNIVFVFVAAAAILDVLLRHKTV